MANPYAGEVSLKIDGEERTLKLTLGALAELEATLKAESLVALVERFETGKYQGKGILALLYAGLKGGGWTGTIEELSHADIEGGIAKAAQVAARLLVLSFSIPPDPS